MARTTPNLGLTVWNLGTDFFSHGALATDWDALDAHDHSPGKGVLVPTAGLANLAVTTPKLADSSVTTAKLADASVATVKIVDANVTTAKIADASVTTAKIADANVTTAKLADAAVTTPKLKPLTNYLINSTGVAPTGSFTDIPGLTWTFSVSTASYLWLWGGAELAFTYVVNTSNSMVAAFNIDGTLYHSASPEYGAAIVNVDSTGNRIDGGTTNQVAFHLMVPIATGSHTVKMQAYGNGAGATSGLIEANYMAMVTAQ